MLVKSDYLSYLNTTSHVQMTGGSEIILTNNNNFKNMNMNKGFKETVNKSVFPIVPTQNNFERGGKWIINKDKVFISSNPS